MKRNTALTLLALMVTVNLIVCRQSTPIESRANAQPTPAPAPPPTPIPTPASVVLPVYPPPVSPSAVPVPLSAGQIYVVSASQSMPVISSPAGILNIQATAGPVTIPESCLVDSCGKCTTRTFSQPFVWLVTPATSGTAELIIMNGAIVQRVTIQASNGPGPVPPGPTPNDPLQIPLQLSFTGETTATKGQLVKNLAAIYRNAVMMTVPRTDLATLGDLLVVVGQAAQVVVPAGQIPLVRGTIATELAAQLGAATAPLDATMRAKVGTQFTRMASLLEAIK